MHEAERPLHQLGSNRIKSKKIHGTTIYVLKTTIDLRLSKPTTRMLHRRRRPIGEPLAHLRFNGQHPETDPHYLLLLNLRLLGMTDHVRCHTASTTPANQPILTHDTCVPPRHMHGHITQTVLG
jgi:hypothetical protein